MENGKQKRKMKGDGVVRAVLKEDMTLKMQLLKARADKVLKDDSLRHTLNEHDIKECSYNTKLLHVHQIKTIRKED